MALILALASGAAPAQERPTLRLSSSPWVADAPTRVAKAMGAFDDAIEVVESTSGKASLEQLLAGEADFALVATTPLALHVCGLGSGGANAEAGAPVVLASVALSNNTHFVLADGDAGIAEPIDLAGRRVGVMFDTSAHFGWYQFARRAGLADAGTQLVDLPITRLAEALLSGGLDAAVVWSPWDRPVAARWGERARRFRIRAVDSVNWLLVSRPAVVDQHRDAAIGILEAYARAVDVLNAEPERARALHARVSDVPLPDPDNPAVGVIWRVALDWSLLANLQANLEWCEQRGGRRAGRVDLAALIAPAVLEAVDPGRVLLPVGLFDPDRGRPPR